MNVVISGYYGFGNLGDEALLAGLIPVLQAAGHQVTVLSGDPSLTAHNHGLLGIHRLWGLPGSLKRCDALISGGGGLLQDKTSRRSLDYYLAVITLARRLGRRVVVYSQSVGPLSPAGERKVAKALKGLPVAVRDDSSRRLLASLGVQAELVADAALLLPPPQVTLAEDGPVLLIPRGGYPIITDGLLALAQALHATGRSLAVMAFQEQLDGPEVARLRAALPLEVWQADSPQAALMLMARAGYVVSARLHGLILAALLGKGLSGIVYDPKVAAFLGELGAPAHTLPLAPDRLAAEVQAGEAPDIGKFNALRARAASGATWLQQVLS
jgi:polysaccharide pyruvyl transferase CsaB